MTSSRKPRLLVVDDAPDTREVLQRNLSSRGYDVITAGDVAEALAVLGAQHVDLVITDLKMPGASGLELVHHVREHLKGSEVITITGYPSVEGAVAAVKSGAEEYLTKPFTQDELFEAVARAIDKLGGGATGEPQPETPATTGLGIVAASPAMQRVMAAISRVAATMAPVLIMGEIGTGKRTIARLIHRLGPRATAPFVVVGCGDAPGDWLETQLFGGARGPSVEPKQGGGLLRLVEDGTVFLSEVSALTPVLQRRLAEALGDHTSRSMGSPQPPRCRVLAASAEDLRARVDRGAFREDLLLRLSTQTLVVPPLRDRGDDIVRLAQRCLTRSASDLHKPVPVLTDRALEVIGAYSWPGNLPELEHCMWRLLQSAPGGPIEVPDLPDPLRTWARAAAGVNRTLADVEADHIRSVLAAVGGNKTRAAEILGINRKTLREKLRDGEAP